MESVKTVSVPGEGEAVKPGCCVVAEQHPLGHRGEKGPAAADEPLRGNCRTHAMVRGEKVSASEARPRHSLSPCLAGGEVLAELVHRARLPRIRPACCALSTGPQSS